MNTDGRFFVRTLRDGRFSPMTLRRLKAAAGIEAEDPMYPCSPTGATVRVTGWFPKVGEAGYEERTYEGRLTLGPWGLTIHTDERWGFAVTTPAFQVRLVEVIQLAEHRG